MDYKVAPGKMICEIQMKPEEENGWIVEGGRSQEAVIKQMAHTGVFKLFPFAHWLKVGDTILLPSIKGQIMGNMIVVDIEKVQLCLKAHS